MELDKNISLFGGISHELLSLNATDSPFNESKARNSMASCSQLTKLILNTGFAGLLCILGFVGNTVSFIVLARDRETPVASFLLRALAFIDNVFLCSWFLHFSLNDLFMYFRLAGGFHSSWLYVRVYTYPLLFIGQSGTIWLTVLIAASRYVAVCKPYKALYYCTVPMVQKATLFVAGFAILYNSPRFFEVEIVELWTNGTFRYSLERTRLGLSRAYNLVYFDVLYYIFSFVLPLLLLTFLNTKLTLAYRVVQKRRSAMHLRQELTDHNITLVMIVVILVFIMCNAPAKIVQIIWGYEVQKCLTLEFTLIEISNVLEVLNSSVNFIIYCVFRNHFRHLLHRRFCAPGRSSDSYLATGLTGLLPTNATTYTTTENGKPDEIAENEV